MEFIEGFRKRVQDHITGNNISKEPSDTLNEELRYFLKYRESLSIQDIEKIIKTPHFELFGPYFGLKAYDGNPDLQRNILDQITNAYRNGVEDSTVSHLVTNFLQENPEIKSLSPNRLARVSGWSNGLIQQRAQEAVQDVYDRQETPVVVAYSGLFGLRTIVENLPPQKNVLIISPDHLDTTSGYGFKLTAEEDQITTDVISPQIWTQERKIALVDDTVETGETLDSMAKAFPNSEVRYVPLFRS